MQKFVKLSLTGVLKSVVWSSLYQISSTRELDLQVFISMTIFSLLLEMKHWREVHLLHTDSCGHNGFSPKTLVEKSWSIIPCNSLQ